MALMKKVAQQVSKTAQAVATKKPAGSGLVRGATNAIKNATAQVKATAPGKTPMGSGLVRGAVANVKRSLKK
jgi:hypothetical protein